MHERFRLSTGPKAVSFEMVSAGASTRLGRTNYDPKSSPFSWLPLVCLARPPLLSTSAADKTMLFTLSSAARSSSLANARAEASCISSSAFSLASFSTCSVVDLAAEFAFSNCPESSALSARMRSTSPRNSPIWASCSSMAWDIFSVVTRVSYTARSIDVCFSQPTAISRPPALGPNRDLEFLVCALRQGRLPLPSSKWHLARSGPLVLAQTGIDAPVALSRTS